MAESIYTVQVPGNNDATNPGGITSCTLFTPAVNGTVSNARWFFPVTNPSSPPVAAIYAWTGDATPSAALATKAWTGVMPSNGWGTFPAFDTPVSVTAGQFYYVAVFSPERFVSTINQFLAGGITNGNLTAPQTNGGIPRANGRFATDPAIAYPTLTNGGNGYFADILFDVSSPIVSGSGLADLGALTATANGTVTTLGSGLADLGSLNATASGSVATTGVALADLGRLVATATTPAPPDPDQFVSVLMNQLLNCLCTYSQSAEGAPTHCCFRVGTEIAHDAGIFQDLCCEGIAYVALGDTYPSSDSFPEADIVRQANAKCAPNTWAQIFQVGIIRCAPMGDELMPPSCDEWNAAARQNVIDALTLRRVACCMRDFVVQNNDSFLGMSLVIDRQIQGNPQGGCVERTMKLTAQFPNCDC